MNKNSFYHTVKGKTTCHMVHGRDSQKSKLYAAERKALNCTERLGFKFAKRLVRRVCRSKTWRGLIAEYNATHLRAGQKVPIRKGAKNWFARGGMSGLTIPEWACNPPVVLHELAHVLVPYAHHNWPFAMAYVRLVSRFISIDARNALRKAFREAGVRFRPPRTMSTERRAALVAQGKKLVALQRAAAEVRTVASSTPSTPEAEQPREEK